MGSLTSSTGILIQITATQQRNCINRFQSTSYPSIGFGLRELGRAILSDRDKPGQRIGANTTSKQSMNAPAVRCDYFRGGFKEP